MERMTDSKGRVSPGLSHAKESCQIPSEIPVHPGLLCAHTVITPAEAELAVAAEATAAAAAAADAVAVENKSACVLQQPPLGFAFALPPKG